MLPLPRLAVGSIHAGVDAADLLGLMALLSGRGRQVQHFHSTACFPKLEGASRATGITSRHLDSWLMTPDACREAFAHGARGAKLAVVDGRYAAAFDPWRGGQLDDLCDWLDLPRLVVIDAAHFDSCRLPARPAHADGLLLDKVHDARTSPVYRPAWNHCGRSPCWARWNACCRHVRLSRPCRAAHRPRREVCQHLAAGFNRYARSDRLCASS